MKQLYLPTDSTILASRDASVIFFFFFFVLHVATQLYSVFIVIKLNVVECVPIGREGDNSHRSIDATKSFLLNTIVSDCLNGSDTQPTGYQKKKKKKLNSHPLMILPYQNCKYSQKEPPA